MKKIWAKYIYLLVLTLLMAGCSAEDVEQSAYEGVEGVRFVAYVADSEQMGTRADDSYYITTEFYDCDFHLCVGGYNYDDIFNSDMSTYVIPSGFEGALIPKGDKEVNWFSRDRYHHFWGWTIPTDLEYTPQPEDIENGITIHFYNTDMNYANDTGKEWKEETAWNNGKCLEQMIGAHSGPMTYEENGIYVPLHFQHIVSKVFLKNLYVIDTYNIKTTSDLKGVITFYGMPTEATLYPCPKDDKGNEMRPRVDLPPGKTTPEWDYDQKNRVSYAMTNTSRSYFWEGHTNTGTNYMYKDCWYIPPELDFSRLEYKIEIYEYNKTTQEWELSLTHGRQGAYYGDFSSVVFKRDGTSKYDDPAGGDETILHAGEYMELTIYLYEKGNPTVQGTLKNWTSRSGTGSSHVHQGVYSYDQLSEMVNAMKESDLQAIEEFYEMNGSGRDTGTDPEDEYPDYESIYGQELKIIELFDDIGNNSYGTSSKLSSLEVADGYILDGQGHTVNVSSSPLTLGPVRDVYIKYHNVGSTAATILYIDKMGNVFRVDPYTFVETPLGYNVNNASSNPFTIKFGSGEVTPQTP